MSTGRSAGSLPPGEDTHPEESSREELRPIPTPDPSGPYEVVVIGAGQAGLAMGYFLRRQGRRFVILEQNESAGSAWRDRWDSLTLFTPRRYDNLPGLAFPGEADGYPKRDEVVAYLRSYAAEFDLPVTYCSRTSRITKDNGIFGIELDGERIDAEQVVVATGPFQDPRRVPFASELGSEVLQLHSTSYRNPGGVLDGPVLVVGGGNTGFQIAEELAAAGRPVHLSIGSRQPTLPQRLLGRDAFWWLTKTRVIYKSVETRVGRRMRAKETLVGSSPKAAERAGIVLHGRATGASGRTVVFEDGRELEVDTVIWATGFRSDYSWIDLPVTENGQVRHERGVAEVPGLYFLGLQWQYTRGSALLGFVKDDAEFIAQRVGDFADEARSSHERTSGSNSSRDDGRVPAGPDGAPREHTPSAG